MPSLGDTTAFLTKMRRHARTRPGAAPGERRCRVTEAFGPNPGALRMLSYTPAVHARNAPLVVVLHGCGQTAEAHAEAAGWLELADRLGFVVLAPEQSTANNFNRCFNWFEPGDTTRGLGEAASIAAMIAHAVAAHDIDPERTFVTGLSAGGAMTATMLATYPELFAGGAVIGGLPFGSAHSLQGALGVMRSGVGSSEADGLVAAIHDAAPGASRPIRLSIWHGSADHVVSAANAEATARQWRGAAGMQGKAANRTATGRTRQTWTDGASTIELNLISGMGHGTPLSTKADGDVGAAAPFMLEVGVSSTLEIAAFWGLADARPAAAARRRPQPVPIPEARPRVAEAERESGVGAQVLEVLSQHVPRGVQEQIARAFKAAGLS